MMRPEYALFPAITLVALTYSVAIYTFRMRLRAVSRGDVNPRYFRNNRGGKLPDYLTQTEQNYCNLFELPVLFYLLVVMLYITDTLNGFQLTLLWGFAISRIVHSIIHITINRLRLRMLVFVFGAVMLMLAWIDFVWKVVVH